MNNLFIRSVRSLFLLAASLASAGKLPAQDAVATTIVHQFLLNGGDGWQSRAGLLRDAAGNFYGTAFNGGVNGYGTIFKVAPDGTYTILHSFDGVNGIHPDTTLVTGNDGNFYGTTADGPVGAPQNGGRYAFGVMFKITPTGEYTVLHHFDETPADGWFSNGLVLGADGNFYGTSSSGGSGSPNSPGAVFRITPQGDYTLLHSFTSDEGASPSAPLILGRDGNFYGTTTNRGTNNAGTIFSMTPDGVLTVLHNSGSHTALVEGADGVFYGGTEGGGSYLPNDYDYAGSVFRITSSGDFTVLHTFDGTDGDIVLAPLTVGGDGNLYGVTTSTVFRLAPGGAVTLLTSFDASKGPLNTLTVDQNGALYGTSRGDDATNGGIFYKLTVAPLPSSFFAAETPVGDGFYYLNYDATHTPGHDFGYYAYFEDCRYIYHMQLGYEYIFDAADNANGVYLYDFKSGDFLYTSPTFPYPYLYDFGLDSVVFYFGATAVPSGASPSTTVIFTCSRLASSFSSKFARDLRPR